MRELCKTLRRTVDFASRMKGEIQHHGKFRLERRMFGNVQHAGLRDSVGPREICGQQGEALGRTRTLQVPPRKRHDTPVGQTGAGHALRLPLWDPPTVLRRLGEGTHLSIPAELAEIRLGSGTATEIDVGVYHSSVASHHATLQRLDESLLVRDAGTGQSFEFDARSAKFRERATFLVNVGDQFALGTVRLMPLEMRLAALVPVLEQHIGTNAHVRVDEALLAIVDARPLSVAANHDASVSELIRLIHAASPRRDHPLTFLDRLPTTPETVDAVCREGACGMMVIDLRKGPGPTDILLDALRSRRYHLWPCFIAAHGSQHTTTPAELNPHWL